MLRRPLDNGTHIPNELGELACECWCRARVVFVPAELVRSCRTLSCGLPCCKPKENQ